MRTERVQMRVFVEGVLVSKVSSATVHTFANEEARASFIMPSIPGFETEELKRARVHIFWSDIEIRNEREDDDWPVLFEGEITGDSFDKSVTSRNQMFFCSGYHTYWEQVLLYYYELGQGTYNKAVWSQNVSVALGNNIFEFDGAVAGANLRQRLVGEALKEEETYPTFVKRIFNDCLDTNHFFRLADAQLKLTSRFTALDDPNLDVLAGRSLLSEAISNDQVTMSGESSMMRTLKAVLDVFRYSIVHNAQPVLLREQDQKRKTAAEKILDSDSALASLRTFLDQSGVSTDLRDSTVSTVDESLTPGEIANLADAIIRELKLTDDEVARQGFVDKISDTVNVLKIVNDPERRVKAQGIVKDGGDLLTQFLLLPDMRFALPPTCNIIFPQDQTQLSLQRNLLQEPTRAIGLPQQIATIPYGLYIAPPELDKAVIPTLTVDPVTTSGFYPPVTAPHRISSGFGPRQVKWRDPITGKRVPHPTASRFHKGIDIARPNVLTDFSGTPVHAFDAGTVTLSEFQDTNNKKRGYGLRVYINHGNGMQTRYAHLQSRTVFKGAKVQRGQMIGRVGNTGVSTGAHLHFEIRINGIPVDPQPHVQAASTQDLANTTVDAPTLTKEAQSITEIGNRKSKQFLDFEYLTPEEEKTGIVPFFDQSVVRAYSFMQFLGKGEEVRRHYLNMLNAEFLWRRYETRSMPALNLPFNPYPVAGFPTLIVDRVRSMIGLISNITHTISVGGGQGVASTTVQVEAPRFWDEGDPYYWHNGVKDGNTEVVSDGSELDGRELPSPTRANFPPYYLDKFVPVNSSKTGDRWWSTDETVVPPNSNQITRPVDQLYSAILGSNVRGIPYQYAQRPSVSRDTNVVFNKAIDGRNSDNTTVDYRESGGQRYRNTIVGYYYHLVATNPELAETYVRSITRRHGATERVIMTTVLGATATKINTVYVGNAFRRDYQQLVNRMNTILAENVAFRG